MIIRDSISTASMRRAGPLGKRGGSRGGRGGGGGSRDSGKEAVSGSEILLHGDGRSGRGTSGCCDWLEDLANQSDPRV